MGLVGPWLSTTRSSVKKDTIDKNKLLLLEKEWKKHNKEMRRTYKHDMQFSTLEEYINWRYSKTSKTKKVFSRLKEVETYRRETPKGRSVDTGGVAGLRKEPKMYTGTLVKGIVVLHKSCLQPVINDEQIKDAARMRR